MSMAEKFLKLSANTRSLEERGKCFCACIPSLKFPWVTERATERCINKREDKQKTEENACREKEAISNTRSGGKRC